MTNQFDELAKGMAQSVTRRQALKKFGIGLAGTALACFGLANEAKAAKGGHCSKAGGRCDRNHYCCPGLICIPDRGGYGVYPTGHCG